MSCGATGVRGANRDGLLKGTGRQANYRGDDARDHGHAERERHPRGPIHGIFECHDRPFWVKTRPSGPGPARSALLESGR